MILTQDLCQLQEDSRVTALTRQQVTFRVGIARVMAAAATRRYALKRNQSLFSIPRSDIRLLVRAHEPPRKSEWHHAFDGIALD